MCTVLLPPGVNPSAVNKYINVSINIMEPENSWPCSYGLFIWGREGVKWARDLVSVGKVGRCGLHEGSMLLPSYV